MSVEEALLFAVTVASCVGLALFIGYKIKGKI